MRSLGDEIAVLDGIDPWDGRTGQTPASAHLYGRQNFAPVMEGLGMLGTTEDGRISRVPADGDEYAKRVGPGMLLKRGVIDASSGGNYSGGSNWSPGLPLTPSNSGLADSDLVSYSRTTDTLPIRRNVIDASGGALYSGGSSWTPGLPLTPSNAGLAGFAASLIAGGYGRAGMGRVDQYGDFAASLIAGGYGSAGMGRVDQYGDFADADFERMAGSSVSIEDGRIGQDSATGDEYAKVVGPFNLERRNMIQASGGANYAGGSSWTPGMPFMPSSVGLAGIIGFDRIDALSDAGIATLVKKTGVGKKFGEAVGGAKMRKLLTMLSKTMQMYFRAAPAQQQVLLAQARNIVGQIQALRVGRKQLVNAAKRAA